LSHQLSGNGTLILTASAVRFGDFDSPLTTDGYIRHCVSGDVIGYRFENYTTVVLDSDNVSHRYDKLKDRKNFFKTVFDKRLWIGGQIDAYYSGLQASG
jgi:hypothetical protein